MNFGWRVASGAWRGKRESERRCLLPPPATLKEEATMSAAPVRLGKVLVIAAEPAARRSLNEVLRGQGLEPVVAEPDAALERLGPGPGGPGCRPSVLPVCRPSVLDETRPVLVVLDATGGLEILRRLRAQDADLPVVVVGPACRPLVLDEDRGGPALEACRLGADAYLTKPVREAELLFAVHKLLRQRDASPRPAGPPCSLPAELESRLRRCQQMEVAGRLVGGVLHDLNNLMTVLLGHGGLLLDRLNERVQAGGDGLLRGHAAEIYKASERAAGLTTQLMSFLRDRALPGPRAPEAPAAEAARPEPAPRVVDLNAVIGGLQQMLGCLLRKNVELVSRLEPRLGKVRADPRALERVLLNFILNAQDAMPQGGRLTLTTANAGVGSQESGARRQESGVREDRSLPPDSWPLTPDSCLLTPGEWVRLSVADTGCGMDAAVQARLFEPYFTTKGERGTGLGLANVAEIVRGSGGYIEVDSAAGRGSTFTVYLPRAEEPAPEVVAAAAPEGAARGWETVLVAENNEPVRRLAVDLLGEHGYRVLAARDGAEALALGEQYRGLVQLLVTDLVLPRMSGFHVAERLQAASPGLKVLYVSGLLPGESERLRAGGAGGNFLQKPFTSPALLERVRALLDGRTPGA
jgi:signal transduction histidine kinase